MQKLRKMIDISSHITNINIKHKDPRGVKSLFAFQLCESSEHIHRTAGYSDRYSQPDFFHCRNRVYFFCAHVCLSEEREAAREPMSLHQSF